MANFSLSSTVLRHPRLPYEQMKDDVLGTSYSLSLVFIGPDRARRLNREHRKKDYVPNVLSFPLDETHGELYITPAVATREAAARGMSVTGYVGFLFIHGMLHLKGMAHGARMEQAEAQHCATYRLS